tara:strand:+ start:932 stop:1243 length:312 start_codon:yes stop_codon:yes gene_type:complete
MDDQDLFYERKHLEAQICLDKYKIEKNISKDKKKTHSSDLKKFWDKLDVGDSFLINHTKKFSLDVAEKIRNKISLIYGFGSASIRREWSETDQVYYHRVFKNK